jgi:hypothetical protein
VGYVLLSLHHIQTHTYWPCVFIVAGIQ